jgi:hypothetical protein
MTQPTRKPGDPPATPAGTRTGKLAETLASDDPSIPVLTERLTLPPLDLDLDFRLPERPAAPLPAAEVPAPMAPAVPPPPEPGPPQPQPPALEPEQPPASTIAPVTIAPLEPIEPPDTSLRVPTSLLVPKDEEATAVSFAWPAPAGMPDTRPRPPEAERDGETVSGIWSVRMEDELRELILLEIARRLPTDVEAIVRRQMDGAIEETMRRFAAEVRIALAASLREIVDRAVKAELEKLRAGARR